MAKPNIELEVWAEETYQLPNALTENKVRPITDLWRKGYDLGQKPDCQAWNYVWFMLSSWLKYIEEEEIPSMGLNFLKKDGALADLFDIPAARLNLEVYSTKESDDRYLKLSGGSLTGGLKIGGHTEIDTSEGLSILWSDALSTKTSYLINRGTGGFVFKSVDDQGVESGKVHIQSDGSIISPATLGASKLEVTGSSEVSGEASSKTLTVQETATVAGKNIARSVNGNEADINGDITLPATTEASKNARGWWRDNSTGMIFQWTYGSWRSYNDERLETVSFPIAFPNACLSVNTGTQTQAESSGADAWGVVAGFDKNGCRVQTQWSGANTWDTGIRCVIFAIGH